MNRCKKSNGRAKLCKHSMLIIVSNEQKVRTHSTQMATYTNHKIDCFREAESTLRRTMMSLLSLDRNGCYLTDGKKSWMLDRTDTLLFLCRVLGDGVRKLPLEPDSGTS